MKLKKVKNTNKKNPMHYPFPCMSTAQVPYRPKQIKKSAEHHRTEPKYQAGKEEENLKKK